VIISERFRLFFDGVFPPRFIILMHDVKFAEEVIGVFWLPSSPAKLMLAARSFNNQLLAEGVVALEAGPPEGVKIYNWLAVRKFSVRSELGPKLTPSTPDEFDRWLSSVEPSKQE
jgi:hypothetical protein